MPLKQALIGQCESSLVWKSFWCGRNNPRWPISGHIDSTRRRHLTLRYITRVKKGDMENLLLRHWQDVREPWTLVLSWFKLKQVPQWVPTCFMMFARGSSTEEDVDVSVDHIVHQGLFRRVDHSLDSLVHCVRKKENQWINIYLL